MAVEKILVIKLGAFGDFIQALGPMAAIRRHHPAAHIILLTTRPFQDFAAASGYADEIWIDTRPKWHDLKGWVKLKRKLRQADFDRVYDLQNNDRTALYLKLLRGSKQPEWVGAAKGASHRNALPARTSGHALDGHRQTLALAGINDIQLDNLSWVHAQNSFSLPQPYILLVPGSAPDRLEKRWPAKFYGELATCLVQRSLTPVVIGTTAEKHLGEIICAACPQAVNLCGQTLLFDLVGLARQATAAIGNDTGPMHLIAPTGCPALVIFSGHSNPKRHAPLGPQVRIVQRNNLEALNVEDVLSTLDQITLRT